MLFAILLNADGCHLELCDNRFHSNPTLRMMASVVSHILTLLQEVRGAPYCPQEVLFKLGLGKFEIYHNGQSCFHVGAVLFHTIEVLSINLNIWPYVCLRISKTVQETALSSVLMSYY